MFRNSLLAVDLVMVSRNNENKLTRNQTKLQELQKLHSNDFYVSYRMNGRNNQSHKCFVEFLKLYTETFRGDIE